MSDIDMLFSPFTVKDLTLRNRVVMAPMTRKCSRDGAPGANVADYYAARAEHGVGLIITEGIAIEHPVAVDDANVPRLFGCAALDGWSKVVTAVHAHGGRIVAQLWHVGAVRSHTAHANGDGQAIAPSEVMRRGVVVAREMSEADIADVVGAYASGAAAAKALGFDGVEIHAAHGYLVDQFLWEKTNRRSDGYGGDVVGRTRFACDVVVACRRTVGPDFPILFRFSQWKLQDYTARLARTPQELTMLLAPLVEAGVDVFDCSTRYFWKPEFPGSDLNLAGWTRSLTGKPTITVGAVGQTGDFLTDATGRPSYAHLPRLAEMLHRGEVDLVAVGRALLADAAWAAKVHADEIATIRPFTPDSLNTLQ
jgi:2,4-dienoyl-CoA reductase-like NADH-dependent reductase (Old Yellow Enzyme family)